jgi:uncharacterized cupin superfamily protein
MAHRRVRATEIEAAPGPHPAASRFDKGVGEALGLTAFGLYQIELPSGEATVAHDHRDDRAEDAYAILRGSGVVIVDGEEMPVVPGDFVAVTPESTRQVRAGEDGLVLIAVCAAVR